MEPVGADEFVGLVAEELTAFFVDDGSALVAVEGDDDDADGVEVVLGAVFFLLQSLFKLFAAGYFATELLVGSFEFGGTFSNEVIEMSAVFLQFGEHVFVFGHITGDDLEFDGGAVFDNGGAFPLEPSVSVDGKDAVLAGAAIGRAFQVGQRLEDGGEVIGMHDIERCLADELGAGLADIAAGGIVDEPEASMFVQADDYVLLGLDEAAVVVFGGGVLVGGRDGVGAVCG